ncbi:hypothetical protein E6C67_11235 [Azospirillum sp. TSA2s]|uniref:TrbG/VirB9 family P-type conjugative transfer protein n=1 Tax=Azospirillum sp. TSA2s TaxID=709810 RepID=UPI0010AAF1AA|nr:TrbG/VirB9 family P-type conjugative transfer protein [Azospirillum sp. TSA2s]QCG94493.1 hypothetical protein E6C67_11235 [Azospirillum sp. TSA2s]
MGPISRDLMVDQNSTQHLEYQFFTTDSRRNFHIHRAEIALASFLMSVVANYFMVPASALYGCSRKVLWFHPERVYTDGRKTYIQFPSEMRYDESPALVAIGADDKEQLVNYRASGDRYVVDKVLRHAALISGVGGDQTKVEILRERN